MEKSSANASTAPWLIIGVIIVLVILGAYVLLSDTPEEPKPIVVEQPVEPEPAPTEVIAEPEPIEPIVEEVIPETVVEVEEPVEVKPLLPSLDESDNWLKEKLPTITWRKELLKLVIDDDMIRRFVVFTDNFSQGMLAYEHSPLIKPSSSFTVKEINQDGEVVMKWDENDV